MRVHYPREKFQKEVGADSFSSVKYARWYQSRRMRPLIEPISR